MRIFLLLVPFVLALPACDQSAKPHATKVAASPEPTAAADAQPLANAPAKAKESATKSEKFGGAFKLDKPEKLSAAIARVDAKQPAPAAGAADDADDAACSDAEVESCSGIVANHEGETVRVSGTVGSVCKKAGCWMVLEEDGQQVRVFTKEHGFFLPKDCEGRAADVEGKLRTKTLSEGFAKHLAEDSGDDPAKVKGKQREYLMTATAITLL